MMNKMTTSNNNHNETRMRDTLDSFTYELIKLTDHYSRSPEKSTHVREVISLIKNIDPVYILREDTINVINSLFQSETFVRFMHKLSYNFFSIHDLSFVISNVSRGIVFYSNDKRNHLPSAIKTTTNEQNTVSEILSFNRHIVIILLIILIDLKEEEKI